MCVCVCVRVCEYVYVCVCCFVLLYFCFLVGILLMLMLLPRCTSTLLATATGRTLRLFHKFVISLRCCDFLSVCVDLCQVTPSFPPWVCSTLRTLPASVMLYACSFISLSPTRTPPHLHTTHRPALRLHYNAHTVYA